MKINGAKRGMEPNPRLPHGAAMDGLPSKTRMPRQKLPKAARLRLKPDSIVPPTPAIHRMKPKSELRGSLEKEARNSLEPSVLVLPGDDQTKLEPHDQVVIAEIRELWKRRENWHRAEKSLTLQALAGCRRYVGGSKTEAAKLLKKIEKGEPTDLAPALLCVPLLAARGPLRDQRKSLEKDIKEAVEQLPIYPWVESIRGFAHISLGGIVGVAGDLNRFHSVSALWKFMGLAVIDGERQRRKTGVAAKEQGYSPGNRAIIWKLADSMIKLMKRTDAYRVVYDREKERQLAKGLTKGHADKRAKRHMSKKLLAHLYGQWTRRPNVAMEPRQELAHKAP